MKQGGGRERAPVFGMEVGRNNWIIETYGSVALRRIAG